MDGMTGLMAMDMGWLTGLVAVFLIFGGGSLVQKWIEGENEAKRIRAEKASGKSAVSEQVIEELRQEIVALRETTTRFDISFDAAITRLEQRMNRVEEQTGQSEPTVSASFASEKRIVASIGQDHA